MLPLLITFVALSASESRRVTFSPISVLHTPDVIEPAVLPYLACLSSVRGVSLLKATPRAAVQYDKNDRDCSATRQRAKVEALKILQHTRVPMATTASAYVENALSDIEDYVAAQAAAKPISNSSGAPAQGLVVALEDEVIPAYNRYADCLKAQVTNTSVTADTLIPTFQRAMSICHGVREGAVAEAENALAKKGWDEATRAKAAESTFVAADQQWLLMGQQFRDSMFPRTSTVRKTP